MTHETDTSPPHLSQAQVGEMVERHLLESHVAQALAAELARQLPQRNLIQRVWAALGAFIAHPLIVTILGFALTSGVVWYLDGQATARAEAAIAQEKLLAWQAEERAGIIAREERAQETVAPLIAVIRARATETGLLASAIASRDEQDIRARRLAHDAAYRDWNNRTNLLVGDLMSALGVPDATWETHNAATAVQTFIGWGQFLFAGHCLDDALEAWREGGASKALDGMACKTHRGNGDTAPWSGFLAEKADLARDCARDLSIRVRVALRARADEQRRVLAGLEAIDVAWLDARPDLVEITEVAGLSECSFE